MPDKPTNMVDVIARERVQQLRDDVHNIHRKLDDHADAEREKLKGDIQLATKFEGLRALVETLDALLVRGNGGNAPSIKSVVETTQQRTTSIKQEVADLRKKISDLEKTVEDQKQREASIRVAEVAAKSDNWKTTAILVGTVITSIVSLAVALLK
jgi:chromosome segregation ATPase